MNLALDFLGGDMEQAAKLHMQKLCSVDGDSYPTNAERKGAT